MSEDQADQNEQSSSPSQGQPTGTESALTPARLLTILEQGAIEKEHGAIRWSSNYTFLLSLRLQDDVVKCIYKPRMGERPLWDFPDGTLCLRERAAFLTSAFLGWSLVPPTVLREGAHGIGSMQVYIPHDAQYHYFNFDASLKPQLAKLALFDCLINNADRKGGHCLVDAQGHLWGIDHGLTFNEVHKLRTVIWEFAGTLISPVLLRDVRRLQAALQDPQSPYLCALQGLLSPEELHAYAQRVARLLRSKRYPKPGHGPNYPFPPV